MPTVYDKRKDLRYRQKGSSYTGTPMDDLSAPYLYGTPDGPAGYGPDEPGWTPNYDAIIDKAMGTYQNDPGLVGNATDTYIKSPLVRQWMKDYGSMSTPDEGMEKANMKYVIRQLNEYGRDVDPENVYNWGYRYGLEDELRKTAEKMRWLEDENRRIKAGRFKPGDEGWLADLLGRESQYMYDQGMRKYGAHAPSYRYTSNPTIGQVLQWEQDALNDQARNQRRPR